MEQPKNLNDPPRQSRSKLFDDEILSAIGHARLTLRGFTLLSVWLLGALLVPAAHTAAAEVSGIHGTVSLSPSCPGAQAEDANCRAPYGGAQLQLTALDGRLVATGRSSAAGRFQLQAPAGHYRLRVSAPAKPVRCPVTDLVVTELRSTLVDIDCDSGMR